jgi:hypothetical protein
MALVYRNITPYHLMYNYDHSGEATHIFKAAQKLGPIYTVSCYTHNKGDKLFRRTNFQNTLISEHRTDKALSFVIVNVLRKRRITVSTD